MHSSAAAKRTLSLGGKNVALLRLKEVEEKVQKERQRAEESLRLLNRAIDAATEGICITGPAIEGATLEYVNRGFEELTGYQAIDVLGKDMDFLRGPGTDQVALDRMHEAIAAGRPCTAEMLNYRKDGTPFWKRVLDYAGSG